jgi:hypothetical protein
LTSLKEISNFIVECNSKYIESIFESEFIIDENDCEEFADSLEEEIARIEEMSLQVSNLLRLANKLFITSSSRETILLSALHTAEYVEENSSAYKGLAVKLCEYISERYKTPKNYCLADAVNFWLESNKYDNVIDFSQYKKNHNNKKHAS